MYYELLTEIEKNKICDMSLYYRNKNIKEFCNLLKITLWETDELENNIYAIFNEEKKCLIFNKYMNKNKKLLLAYYCFYFLLENDKESFIVYEDDLSPIKITNKEKAKALHFSLTAILPKKLLMETRIKWNYNAKSIANFFWIPEQYVFVRLLETNIDSEN